MSPRLTLVPVTQPLPALHSDLADAPTTILPVALLRAITGHSSSWMTAQQTTDAFTRLERQTHADRVQLLPPPTPDARTCVLLLRPWRAWLRGCGYRRVRARKRRELLAFLTWSRSHLLLLPSEVRETTLLAYQLWLAEQTMAGLVRRTVAKRRMAVARAALLWRDRERAAWLALEPAA